jgi:hypothetical protein
MPSEEEVYGIVFEPGSVFFRQDEEGETMYVIQSGAAYAYSIPALRAQPTDQKP